MHNHPVPVRRVTEPPAHHFFGYFDKCPWEPGCERLLAHRITFTARQPKPGEKAVLGVIGEKGFAPVAESDAWCWQQGCMLQWFAPGRILYNDRDGDRFVARILDLADGRRRTLCRPIYCLSPDRRWGLSLNFSRLDRERPGYGYPGGADPTEHVDTPDDDGIWLVDIERNIARLVVSIAEVTRRWFRAGMENTPGWFNHLLFNPDGARFAFFHRWRLWFDDGTPRHLTHMFTADRDGGAIFPLNLEDMSSHYTWYAPDKLVNYSRRHATGDQYHLFTDRTDKVEVLAPGVFDGDGHCSFSPGNRWLLTDSYPYADGMRHLYLYDTLSDQAYEIGRFYSDPSYPAPTRCDLHPRWSADGRLVCFDSTHEGTRQIYVADVAALAAAEPAAHSSTS